MPCNNQTECKYVSWQQVAGSGIETAEATVIIKAGFVILGSLWLNQRGSLVVKTLLYPAIYRKQQEKAAMDRERQHYEFEYRSFPGTRENEHFYTLFLLRCGTLEVSAELQNRTKKLPQCKPGQVQEDLKIVTVDSGQGPSKMVVQSMETFQPKDPDGDFVPFAVAAEATDAPSIFVAGTITVKFSR